MLNKNRLIYFFESLAKINSPSKNEKEIIEFLNIRLKNLGFKTWEDNAGKITGGNANNLYGILKGNPKYKSICFNAHTDTVLPTENINIINDGKIIKTDGKTVLGADDKAGIAISIEAIRSIIEDNLPHGDIYVLFTVQEEIGSFGAKNISKENFNPDYIFSFDSDPLYSLVVSAPSRYEMDFNIIGKASHAAHPINSINAISVMAKALAQIPTGQIENDLCCNIGLINGGTRTNVVPDLCSVKIEARSTSEEKVKTFTDKTVEIFKNTCSDHGAGLEQTVTRSFKSFSIDQNDQIFDLAYKTCKECVDNPYLENSLGGYDANEFNEFGMKTIVCGIGYQEIHSNKEFIMIDDMYKACEFANKLLINIAKE